MIDLESVLIPPAKYFIEPVQKGHEFLNLKSYAWLMINNRTGEHILFDLGFRKDWENSTPLVQEIVKTALPGIQIEQDVSTVLEANQVNLDQITAAILSHWHMDHTGNLSLFPKSTQAIFGPSWKQNFGTWYPTNLESPYHEYEFEGRDVIELKESDFKGEIAGLKAHDYFGDGSFYILHASGHTAEHICGLVRTSPSSSTEESTFVLLGGDSCHFMGVMRPTDQMPLPDNVTGEAIVSPPPQLSLPCACDIWTHNHPRADKDQARRTPFYLPSNDEARYYLDHAQAMDTIAKLQALDANPNVLVTIAHDPSLGEVLPKLDSKSNGLTGKEINDWKRQGWKKKLIWSFLRELPRADKAGMPHLVKGQYRAGTMIQTVEEWTEKYL